MKTNGKQPSHRKPEAAPKSSRPRPPAPAPRVNVRVQAVRPPDKSPAPAPGKKPAATPPAPVVSNPLLILVSAPSGGGKTTLCQQVLASNPNITRAITCTTRPPRKGEQNGVDYYFLDASTFLKRVQAGHFLEHATVHGNSYGTLKSEVLNKLRAGKDVMLNVDVQGAAAIREQANSEEELKRALITVFLTTATLGELEARLKKRGTDSNEIIQRRLGVARQEIAQWKNFAYLIISTSIAEDVRRMQAIIDSEKMRTTRAQPPRFD